MISFILLTLTAFFVSGVVSVDTDRVTINEGDSVTLQTAVTTIHLEDIKWYYNNIRIAQTNGDQSFSCIDVQCNKGTERFRDRLKLDQTGSLTITNTTTTDSGVYVLKIMNKSSISQKTFNLFVQSVSDAKRDEMMRRSVKEGESVTLDPGVTRNTNDVMAWYFYETLIAEITGDQSQICSEDECKERFRDRLKLDQTGSLTITYTRNTDTGDYKLQIISGVLRHRRSISITTWKTFILTVFDCALSSAAVAGICVLLSLVVVVVAAAVIYYGRHQPKRKVSRRQCRDQKSCIKDSSDSLLMDTANTTSPDGNETEAVNQTLM